MASSGTYAFAPSNGELVLSAFARLQIFAPELTAAHMTNARSELNYMFVEWANTGPNLWKVPLFQIPLVSGQATYPIDPTVIMILDAYRSTNTNTDAETRIPMVPITRSEYASYPKPTMRAPPTVFWFDRMIAPTVTLYPTPTDGGPYVYNFYGAQQLQDADYSGAQTPDVPYRWFDALVAGLAHRMARIYRPAIEQLRKADAAEAFGKAATQDTENAPTRIAPGVRGYYI